MPAIEIPGGAGAANAEVDELGNSYVNANGIAGFLDADDVAFFAEHLSHQERSEAAEQSD